MRLSSAALLAFIVAPSAWCVDVPVNADTYVLSNTANNYGTQAALYVSSNSTTGVQSAGLLRLDLSALPSELAPADVTHARLTLYLNKVSAPGVVNVCRAASAFNETTVNWAGRPGSDCSGAITISASRSGAYVFADITALVQTWLSTGQNFGISIEPGSANLAVYFDSKENSATSHPAYVSIAWRGPAGPRGLQGEAGPAGVPGATGPAGAAGSTGPTGPQGLQGATGSTGAPGATGAQGTQGPTGPQGAAGSTGIQGIQGPTGATGPAGPSGAQGAKGATGAQGAAGPSGLQGVRGATGSQGPAGPTGAQGGQGSTGPQGAIGPTGPQGAQGATGPQGAVGAPGPTGPAGSPGLQGAQGPTGGTGAQGATGATGQAGLLDNIGKVFFCELARQQGLALPSTWVCPKFVFLTSTPHTANMGGVAGADQMCQNLASTAGLPGNYKAWLSSSSSSPATTFTRPSSPYILVNGTIIANGWSDLTDGSLRAPINWDERGNEVGYEFGHRIWTSTRTDGTANLENTCGDWTSDAGNGDVGLLVTFRAWTDDDRITQCSARIEHYCFQQ
jgi:hypothetical protein